MLDGVQLHCVDSVEAAGEFMRWLSQSRSILAIDTETEGLQWWKDKVRLIQFGDAQSGWAVPWDRWGGVAIEALGKYNGNVVMHNCKFDVHMIETWCGVELPRHRVHDTRIKAHIIDPSARTGLKPLAAKYVDAKAATASRALDEAMTANNWDWRTVPVDFELYWAYGALDTVLTARLDEALTPLLDAPKAYELEMAVTWVISRMESNGTVIDVPYTTERLGYFVEYCERVEHWCREAYGVQPGSNRDIAAILQRDGIQLTKRTPGGALSLDREVLTWINEAHAHPLAAAVLQRRRLQKLASTYLENFLRLEVNGRVHPSFNTLKTEDSKYGARTGRMSVTEPALQTLPRHSEANPAAISVRNCITAGEDRTLVMTDFDQIEQRLVAHYGRDPGLINAFTQGDFFTNIAREIYHDPALEKRDPRRQLTKNAMYALSYGAGPEKIALTARAPVDEVRGFLLLLDQRFPGIHRLQQEVERVSTSRLQSEGTAYVRSPLTGRRHTADHDRAYALTNYLIQGTAGEVLKYKNLELAAAGLDEFMILDVHDEVILDVPNDQLQDVVETTARIMNDSTMFDVPITATTSVGPRWSEKREVS